MKKYIVYASAVLLILAACNQKKDETTNVNNERDSLIAVINDRDAMLNDFLAVNSEIEKNLDSVAVKQGALSILMLNKNETELKSSYKDRINTDINSINELMLQNHKKINELTAKLKKSNVKVEQYDKIIKQLNERIAYNDQEFTNLNAKIASLNTEIATLQTSISYLNFQNDLQQQKIEQQSTELQTAYYIIGKSKDLKDKNVINKTGGLLGIGKTSQIDPNIDNSKFTKIDYTQTNVININSKDAKLITTHPADSYKLEKDKDSKMVRLMIINPDKFWSASKYLVIVED